VRGSSIALLFNIFEMNAKPYQFVIGAPIADGTGIWILHDPKYRPSTETEGARDDRPFVGGSDLGHCG
jgi:hypothetical protein